MALAEVYDIEAVLGRDLTSDEEPRVHSLIELAGGVVQAYTRQDFVYVEDDEVTIRPYDGAWLLPQRPVVAVDSITMSGSLLAGGGYSWTRDGVLAPIYGCWSMWGPTGLPAEAVVVYSHGFENIPVVVRLVVAEMVRNVVTNPSQVRSESLGAYAVTYTIDAAGAALGLGLTDAHQRLLNPYRRRITSVPILSESRKAY